LNSTGVSSRTGSPSIPTFNLPLGESTSRRVVVQRAHPSPPAW
jgi:hypothetical protein